MSKNRLLRVKLTIFFTYFISSFFFSQDYTRYYELIDSANYFKSVRDDIKVDQYYVQSLSSYRGFPDDYSSAILYNYFVNKKLSDTLIKKAFNDGLTFRDFKSTLNLNNIVFSEKQIKKLYRKNKLKITTSCIKLYRLLIRDQISRNTKRGNMQKTDSITGQKLIKLLRIKPELFDRFKTGFLGSEILDILMIHSGWKNLNIIQDSIYELTRKGFIKRETFANIIERDAFTEGTVFEIDSSNTKIIAYDNKKLLLCDFYYPNICFNYGRVYDKERKKTILPPTHPYLTEDKLNSLRSHLFLSDINLLYSNPSYPKVTQEEYCKSKSFK